MNQMSVSNGPCCISWVNKTNEKSLSSSGAGVTKGAWNKIWDREASVCTLKVTQEFPERPQRHHALYASHTTRPVCPAQLGVCRKGRSYICLLLKCHLRMCSSNVGEESVKGPSGIQKNNRTFTFSNVQLTSVLSPLFFPA